MARVRHLQRAPIVEAIVDFRAVLPPEFKIEEFRAVREHLLRDYPEIAESKRVEAKFEYAPGQQAKQAIRDLGVQGIVVKSEDGKTIGQFRVDGFTLNRLSPYTSWLKIEPEAVRLWNIYAEIAKPLEVTRVALRYINRMTLPKEGTIEDYLHTGPNMPEGVPRHFLGFATQTVLEDPERALTAHVIQIFEQGAEPSGHGLLFDIDASKVGPITESNLKGILDDLHDYKNSIFFGSLTERFVESFE